MGMGPGTVPAHVLGPAERRGAGAVTARHDVAYTTTRVTVEGHTVASITIVGDGPAGLSAALFLAKNGHEVVVYGEDETALHYAHLHNYLGVPDVDGSGFQQRAREQVRGFGAELVDAKVVQVDRDGDGFLVQTADGDERRSDVLIVAGAKPSRSLLEDLGAEIADAAPVVDEHYATTVGGLYAVGRVARPGRSQAIISAGAGAVAALDILSRIAGEDVTDWDTPDDD